LDGNLQPEVAFRQQLIRAGEPDTLQPMVVSDEGVRTAFSKRLRAALVASPLAPPDPRAWRGWMAKRYGVSTEAVRKWLSALSIPEMTTLTAIALDLHVAVEHLLTGRSAAEKPAEPALTWEEAVLLANFRAAPPLVRDITRSVVAAVPAARKLHLVAERSAGYEGARDTSSAHNLDIDVLRHILQLVETVDEGTPDQRARVIAAFYDAAMDGGKKATKAAVLKLIRSA
jgi:transcriptional regulator with XRE-family HTH domain